MGANGGSEPKRGSLAEDSVRLGMAEYSDQVLLGRMGWARKPS